MQWFHVDACYASRIIIQAQQWKGSNRFRFVAPQIGTRGESLGFEDLADDIQFLCDDIARPALLDNDWREGQIVISLSGQETAFGEPAPDVTQFFQPFTLSADRCIWEDF